jgi:hypothetical protein
MKVVSVLLIAGTVTLEAAAVKRCERSQLQGLAAGMLHAIWQSFRKAGG